MAVRLTGHPEQAVVVGGPATGDVDLAQPRGQRLERHRRGRLGGPEREEQRLARLERALHPLGGDALTQLDDGAQYLSEDAGGLLGPALVAELAPEGIERWPEVANQLVGDLAHRLGLLGQLGQVMPVVDGPAPERLALVYDDTAGGTDHIDLLDANERLDRQPDPVAPDRVGRAGPRDQAAARDLDLVERCPPERHRRQ